MPHSINGSKSSSFLGAVGYESFSPDFDILKGIEDSELTCFILDELSMRDWAYSEPCQASMIERFEKQLKAIIIFGSYDYFHNIMFSSSWNKYDFLMLVYFSVQKSETVNFDIPPQSFTVIYYTYNFWL